jgi:class 3 adenylate cyclase/tetratricopeptide (TPR) repeat protein
MATCAACGREQADDARFCSACGAPVAARAAGREERKVVTVLFADLVGFTSRAEQLDPEEVRAVLQPYHAHLRAELERHGGTVEKFIGDAVMALFGAPVAHEDDAERAVRAALAIRDWATDAEAGLQLRIAVTTGEALVNLDARPTEGEGMAAGDVVNSAARLQSAAPVNGILVGETTFRATRHVIDYREAEPVEAKGKAAPIAVWEALQARARFGVDVRQHGAATLVGRDRELALLADTLSRVRVERSPQLVTLVGVPGIGKSRLVHELFGIVDADPDLISWRQGRCLPYGDGVAFWALGEMVKAEAGILESDSPAEAGRKLAEVAKDPWVESHLRPLAGLADASGGGSGREESFAAWRQFFEALAEERPLVLVFEDLHWADIGLLEFVDHLVDWTTGVPILALCTARPELLERRAGWGGGKLNATTLSLSPLREDETARLLAELLQRSVLAAETQAALLERAGGNPLYAEQYAALYAESGSAEGLGVPESVQGIIAARIDGLPHDEKALLHEASVQGKVFWTGPLGGAAAANALHALERKGFVARERRSSVEGDDEYAFRHLLVRDVAYGQIPRLQRAEKHHRVAEWIEALGRPADQIELLAHHRLAAFELTRASGKDSADLVAPAHRALREAGDRAFRLGSFASAARLYDSALELCSSGDLEWAQVFFARTRSLSRAEGVDREVAVEARDALLRAGDAETAADAEALLAGLAWSDGDRDSSMRHLDGALALVDDAPASASKAHILSETSRYRMLASEAEEAIDVGLQALAMAEELGLAEAYAEALINIGTARANGGDRRGFEDLRRSVELGLAANSPAALRAYNNLADVLFRAGELREAIQLWGRGHDLARRMGSGRFDRFYRGMAPALRYIEGAWDECAQLADEFLADVDAGDPHYLESACRTIRARVRFARGDVAGALADASSALSAARRAKDPQALAPPLSFAARIHAHEGRLDEAARHVDELVALTLGGFDPGDDWPDVVEALLGLGRRDELGTLLQSFRETGWTAAARLHAAGDPAAAADVYEQIGARPDEAHARLSAAKALAAAGRRAEADEQLAQALGFFRSVGAARYVREGETLLAATG